MDLQDSLNRLTKWRTVFASWQLGTRFKGDGELAAVKDHREITILLRAEVSALTGLLIEKGLISAEEFTAALHREADQLNADYEKRFPGMTASLEGITYDIARIREAGTMDGWPP